MDRVRYAASRLQTLASEGTRGQGFCFGWQIFFGEQTPLTIKRAPGPSHGNGITQLATSAATPPLGEAVGPTTRGILALGERRVIASVPDLHPGIPKCQLTS